MGWAAIIGLVAALLGVGEEAISNKVDSADEENVRSGFKDEILRRLKQNGFGENSEVYQYVNSRTSSELFNTAKDNGLIGTSSSLLGFGGDYYDTPYWDDIIQSFTDLGDISVDPSEIPEYKTDDEIAEEVMAQIEAEDARQTELFENQLQENQMMFDEYRSNILQNQYQQNAQLMGSVDSAMSKARRNALEAGASAGLRMAENINTTLALQNKQAQTSLETSNQLAQQLLNQRQASAGIRSNYSDMIASKQDRYYDRFDKATAAQDRINQGIERNYLDKFDDYNAYSGGYANYLRDKYKQSNTSNKTDSQYYKTVTPQMFNRAGGTI